jgi:hypothetical protein
MPRFTQGDCDYLFGVGSENMRLDSFCTCLACEVSVPTQYKSVHSLNTCLNSVEFLCQSEGDDRF